MGREGQGWSTSFTDTSSVGLPLSHCEPALRRAPPLLLSLPSNSWNQGGPSSASRGKREHREREGRRGAFLDPDQKRGMSFPMEAVPSPVSGHGRQGTPEKEGEGPVHLLGTPWGATRAPTLSTIKQTHDRALSQCLPVNDKKLQSYPWPASSPEWKRREEKNLHLGRGTGLPHRPVPEPLSVQTSQYLRVNGPFCLSQF